MEIEKEGQETTKEEKSLSQKSKEFLLGKGDPLVVHLFLMAGIDLKTARIIGALLQVLVLVLVIVAFVTFMEWRFVAFEAKGCAAYCDCVARMGNRTYSV